MSGRTLAEVLADGLRALAGNARPPSDAADRALARMRRRRTAARVGGPTVAVAAVGSLVAALAVVPPAPIFDWVPDSGVNGCEPALVAAHLTYPDDGSAPTASVYDWPARCDQFRETRFAWAVDNYQHLAVLGRAGDPRGRVSPAARELGILDTEKGTERWVELPSPGWAAFWSPDHEGSRIVVSLAQRAPGGPSGSDGPVGSAGSGGGDGRMVFGGYVIVDPDAAEITQTVTVDEPALTPFQWTPDGRRVVAAFPDGIRFFERGGQVTRELAVQGTIPVPAAVSRDGERILVQPDEQPDGQPHGQPHGQQGSGRYFIVSIADGDVVRRVTVDGTVLGWLGNEALMRVEHGEDATELHSLDLVPPTDPSVPALKTFDPEVDTVIPRLDMVYADPGPPPRSPVTDPERSPTTR